jgi:hypothetical protein
LKDRIPHKENRGITIVAKPATKVVVFLAAVLVGAAILLAVNALLYGF